MSVQLQEMVHFHLTGKRGGGDLEDAAKPGIRSALLARYSDLEKLRYDYPLVLVERNDEDAFVYTLSGVVDRLLQKIAPRGVGGGRVKAHVLRLEVAMRELVSGDTEISLSNLWNLAEEALLSASSKAEVELLRDSLKSARGALQIEGQVVGCDDRAPARLLQHVWTMIEAERAHGAMEKINTLILKLGDIVKVDDLKSAGSRTPQNLKNSLGERYQDAFDFELMSRLLNQAAPQSMLPAGRRRRIQSTLAVLESQKFFASTGASEKRIKNKTQYRFVFNTAANALKAYRERLPEMAELIKAITIAELEIENRYRESKHDSFLQRLDAQALAGADLLFFPSYLICLHEEACGTRVQAELMEIFSSDLPMKVLVQSSDILGEPVLASGRTPHGVSGQQLANTVVGLGDAYVLQSANSNLYQARDEIRRGLVYQGPALFSVFTGSSEMTPDLPPYLSAAVAMESRVFPAFVFDPAAGQDLATRFSVKNNPQVEEVWPRQQFCYEDEDLQKVSEDVAFTFADFVANDRRYADHFADVPRDSWSEDMVPAAEYLSLGDEDVGESVPYILMVDGEGILHRLVVDDQVIRAARRCSERWRNLQEQGGINNSHALELLAREREIWEREKDQEIADLRAKLRAELSQAGGAASSEPGPVAQKSVVPETAEPEEGEVETAAAAIAAPPSDEPHIETPRCTTCDECTDLNNRMFAYDENKQAYIADISAGTYHDLVEAAETCQVCIIHPGKPKNPDEPGLDELIKRAELFN
jgi:hypothetical protein